MSHVPSPTATVPGPAGPRPWRAGPSGPSGPSGSLVPGPVLFARYAYPPNALGYCGPGDPATLLGMASEGVDLAGLSQKAAQFEGAWPYLELIAGCNGISEPLDRRVVEAYWTGNELVTRVPTSALIASLDDRFATEGGAAPRLRDGGGARRCPTTQLSRLRRVPVARASARRHGRAAARRSWTAVVSDGDSSRRSPVIA